MPHELIDLDIEEISGVDAAANKRTFLIVKRVGAIGKDANGISGDDALPLTTLGRLRQRQLWSEWGPLWYAFNDSVHAMMDRDSGDGEDMPHGALLLQSIAEFQGEAQRILTSMGLVGKAASFFAALSEVEKIGAVMTTGRKQRLRDAIAALQAILDEAEPQSAETMKGRQMAETLQEAIARADAAEAQNKALVSAHAAVEHENETLKAQVTKHSLTPEQEEEAFLKSMPESFRKRWEADKTRTTEALETARIEKDARQRQEYIEKTATYRQVGMTPDHHNVLKAIDTLPEQERTELLRILKSADAVIKGSKLFVSHGSDGVGSGTTAGDRLMAQAEALVKDKSAATLGEAMEQVNKADPGLYREYQAEQRDQSRSR